MLGLVATLRGSAEAKPPKPMEHMQAANLGTEQHREEQERALFAKLEERKMNALRKQGMGKYVESIPHLEHAFQEGKTESCTCIDERIPGGKVRLAGSGILLSGGAEQAAELLIAAGVKEVTSHEGCGAAALAAKQAHAPDANVYGQEFAKRVAALMSQKIGYPVRHRHIAAAEMRPPKDFYSHTEISKSPGHHPAQAVYYDFTGGFNPTKVPELPLGFVSSRRYVGPETATHDAQLAVKIALGAHGLGKDYFQNGRQVRVIIVARSAQELQQAKAVELAPVMQEFGETVAIDGFVVPRKLLPPAENALN